MVGSSRKSTGGSIISSMPIFVLFLSPPETPRILCVPTCKTSQSEQPSIHVPHSMNYNTDCSNSSRLPLVDHTDQYQTQIHPFIGGSVAHTRFTYSHQNSYTYYRSISQTTFMLTVNLPICSTQQEVGHVGLFGKQHSVISCTRPRVFIRSPPNLVNMISRH